MLAPAWVSDEMTTYARESLWSAMAEMLLRHAREAQAGEDPRAQRGRHLIAEVGVGVPTPVVRDEGELASGLLDPALQGEQRGHQGAALWVVAALQRGLRAAQRLGLHPAAELGLGEHEVGAGRVSARRALVERERLFDLSDRLLVAADRRQEPGEPAPRRRVLGSERDAALEGDPRALVIPRQVASQAEPRLRVAVVRIERDGAA